MWSFSVISNNLDSTPSQSIHLWGITTKDDYLQINNNGKREDIIIESAQELTIKAVTRFKYILS